MNFSDKRAVDQRKLVVGSLCGFLCNDGYDDIRKHGAMLGYCKKLPFTSQTNGKVCISIRIAGTETLLDVPVESVFSVTSEEIDEWGGVPSDTKSHAPEDSKPDSSGEETGTDSNATPPPESPEENGANPDQTGQEGNGGSDSNETDSKGSGENPDPVDPPTDGNPPASDSGGAEASPDSNESKEPTTEPVNQGNPDSAGGSESTGSVESTESTQTGDSNATTGGNEENGVKPPENSESAGNGEGNANKTDSGGEGSSTEPSATETGGTPPPSAPEDSGSKEPAKQAKVSPEARANMAKYVKLCDEVIALADEMEANGHWPRLVYARQSVNNSSSCKKMKSTIVLDLRDRGLEHILEGEASA